MIMLLKTLDKLIEKNNIDPEEFAKDLMVLLTDWKMKS